MNDNAKEVRPTSAQVYVNKKCYYLYVIVHLPAVTGKKELCWISKQGFKFPAYGGTNRL